MTSARLYLYLARLASRASLHLVGRARAHLPPPPPVPVVALDLDRLPAGAFLEMPLGDAGSYAHASHAQEVLRLLGCRPASRSWISWLPERRWCIPSSLRIGWNCWSASPTD